jgi:hypothetical protein
MSGLPLQATTAAPPLNRTRAGLCQSIDAFFSLFIQDTSDHTFPLFLLDTLFPSGHRLTFPVIVFGHHHEKNYGR